MAKLPKEALERAVREGMPGWKIVDAPPGTPVSPEGSWEDTAVLVEPEGGTLPGSPGPMTVIVSGTTGRVKGAQG